MRRIINIKIGDEAKRVGSLLYNQQGSRESADFEYDAAWLDLPDRFALEPALPLVTGPQFHRKEGAGSVFHAAIADTNRMVGASGLSSEIMPNGGRRHDAGVKRSTLESSTSSTISWRWMMLAGLVRCA